MARPTIAARRRRSTRQPRIQSSRPGQGQVIRDRAGHHQPLALAVLGHQDDPRGPGLGRRRGSRRAGRPPGSRPESDRVDAEERPGQLGPARADQAGQAEDLAASELEADAVDPRSCAGPRTARTTASPGCHGGPREVVRDVAADHQPDQLVGLERRSRRWVPTFRPSRSTVIRSASRRTSSSRCEM